MLIDTESGRIVNVAECDVEDPTAIGNIASDGSLRETGRYDLTGMPVDKDYRGVVVVTYSDGSVSKQISR